MSEKAAQSGRNRQVRITKSTCFGKTWISQPRFTAGGQRPRFQPAACTGCGPYRNFPSRKRCLVGERLARPKIARYHPRFDFSGVSEDRLSNRSATALSARATFGDLSGATAPQHFRTERLETRNLRNPVLAVAYASLMAMMAALANLNPRSVCFLSG